MNKHSWIIGGSSGIGAALAKSLAEKGETIGLSGRNVENLQMVLEELPTTKNQKHLSLPCDITKADDIEKTLSLLQSQWDTIDRIIFMAGDYAPMELESLDMEKVENIVRVNILSVFSFLHIILPAMKKQKGGQIILCASLAGYRGLPNSQPYGATKAALINLAETLRCECGDVLDIKLINPGFVKSRLTDKNDFKMPFLMTAEAAAKAIVKDIDSGRFEITFPKRFSFLMKTLRILPQSLYFRLLRKR